MHALKSKMTESRWLVVRNQRSAASSFFDRLAAVCLSANYGKRTELFFFFGRNNDRRVQSKLAGMETAADTRSLVEVSFNHPDTQWKSDSGESAFAVSTAQ